MFRIVKFRTLASATDDSPGALHDIEGRVFRFGRFLRRSRIDELPQLLMIFVSAMSYVGPRPETQYFHERSEASIPCYAERLRATPGLTGWAQIRYAHTTTEDEYRDKTAYDLWYVVRRGMILDAKILVRTVGTLLNRFGSR